MTRRRYAIATAIAASAFAAAFVAIAIAKPLPRLVWNASPPAWAAAMKRRQSMTHGATVLAHTMKAGDSHGGGAGPDIKEKD